MAQIQERMSETRQAKTEDTVWVKVMNERHNISQKAGDGYWLRLNGLSVGADCTIRLGRGYTTRGSSSLIVTTSSISGVKRLAVET
ncbi:hypothetical protein BJP44_05775 [Candidatus Williamhamiltonella defendens]|uniref:Uncharacterized protein n=2 Tax=Candidatus Williamhamiltonella defendens TaxID=138072 RepID=C4K5V7_HAMD5|nr:hypothetical protein HDEF_1299 [Candidatus Hamiltonella defensa 5AT (Acyrthosiphon pisum)]ATW22589.1 hypothetical protein BJP44_05775 [Candidatus Hamiltonella defensa]